jgi:hypothetical protein
METTMPSETSPASAVPPAQITVTRDSPDDVQTRQIIVSLDGERKGELMFGEAITIPALPGRHTLRVDNTWNHKDLELNISTGSDLRFVAKSSAGQFSRFLLVAFGAGPIYVSIEPASPISGGSS